MTPDPTSSLPAAGPAGLALLLALAGCGVFKSNDEAQAIVNQRVVGQPAGDFFEKYGPWKARVPRPDGSVEYSWISEPGATPFSGNYGQDSRTCTLRLVVGRNGRVASATVVIDNPGRTSTSRCTEMFKGG